MSAHKLNQPTLRLLDFQLPQATISLESYPLGSQNSRINKRCRKGVFYKPYLFCSLKFFANFLYIQ